MSQLADSAIPTSSHQQIGSSRPIRPTLDLEARDLRQISPSEGKETTIHDFLSLCGTGINASSTSTLAKNGSPNSVTTQDLLQPLQKNLKPVATVNVLPAGFVLSAVKPQTNGDYGSNQQLPYAHALVNGNLETSPTQQSKYRPANINCLSKTQVSHGMPVNKHNWQQQQGALDVGDICKRPRIPSEEDDEDDDELINHSYNSKREGHFQKSDSAHLFEGRNADSKALTPRSKHSATEQRRRSKINDRFQMLRQLLPNADQKRDKASFLLEVIEYIQMLHEKVKNYEAAERGIQQQERTSIISWDVRDFSKIKTDLSMLYNIYYVVKYLMNYVVRFYLLQKNPGHKDAVSNNPYVSDSNGFIKPRLSPLRTTENNITASELMSCMSQSAVHQGGSSGSPPNFENKHYVSKPALLTFSQSPAISTSERAAISVFQSRIPEGQRMFGSVIQPDEQFAVKTKGSQQINDNLAQVSSHSLDQFEDDISRNPENNSIPINYKRSDDEREDGKRSSKLQGRSPTEAMNSCKKEDDRSQHAFDENDGSRSQDILKGEPVPANQTESPAILGGVINISSAYSQGLLDTLTRALQSSGVDLGQATISVQIDLGKPGNIAMANSNKSLVQQQTTLNTGILSSQSKESGSSQESEQAWKRPKFEIDP